MTSVSSLARPGAERLEAEPTVGQLGERALIERIRARVPAPPPWLVIGIGDDAAVLEPARGTLDVITTDALIEGIHFDLTSASPADVGYKALAVNLSDLGAMGAAPRAAVLSLGIGRAVSVTVVDALVDGFLDCATRHRTVLVGGNISRSPGPLVISVTALGSAKRRKILTRSGARPGDAVYVSGAIGAAAAALSAMSGIETPEAREIADRCGPRLLRPEPRVALGLRLGRTRLATACIDLSDGLADGARQIAEASGVGVIIEADEVPVDADARRWFERSGVDPILAAVGGGEDYELLFTVSRKHRRRLDAALGGIGTLRLTCIGAITKEREVRLRRGGTDEPLPPGFAHF